MNDLFGLTGQVALITGATHGLGMAMAKGLGKAGATLVINGNTPANPIRVDGHPFNEFIINRTPAGRWGYPDDLEGTAIFLASKASNFINGQIIYVDGGILATIGKPRNEQ